MKKLFTLVCGLALALCVNAQEVKNLTFGGNSWNMGSPSSNFVLAANSQWGEFKLVSSTVDLSQYKGYKLEYSDLNVGTPVDGNQGFQLKIEGNPNDLNTYTDLPEDQTVLQGDFKGTEGTVTTLNLQAKCKDASVRVVKFSLIKTDGTEEAVAPGGVFWGCAVKNSVPGSLVFSGQYGSQEVWYNDGTDTPCSFKQANSDEAQSYYFEFENDITSVDLMFELDNAANEYGFAYIHTAADQQVNNPSWATVTTNSVQFTLTSENCVNGDNEKQDVDKIMIKAAGSTGWPFEAKVKKATVTLGTTTGITNIVKNAINLNAPIYNLAGQQVSKAYKGVVIQNGKKFVQK